MVVVMLAAIRTSVLVTLMSMAALLSEDGDCADEDGSDRDTQLWRGLQCACAVFKPSTSDPMLASMV